MASEHTAGTQTHFARRATGFVREVKVRDAVIFNVLPACPGLVMAVSVFWVLSSFAEVNVYVAILITAVCSFLISGAFGLLSQIMPRSGADYILISRSLHPALAVGSSILIGTSSMIAMGYWGVFTAKICIGPMLTMVGVAADSSTAAELGDDGHLERLEHGDRPDRDRRPGARHGVRHAAHDAGAAVALRAREHRLHRGRDHAPDHVAVELHQLVQRSMRGRSPTGPTRTTSSSRRPTAPA